jgi:microtubule-associated protein 1
VGNGKMEMYIIRNEKDSSEIKEFIYKWNENENRIFDGRKESGRIKDLNINLKNIVYICDILVWKKENNNEKIKRIMFNGRKNKNKIFEGLEKLKNIEFIKNKV